jgi:3-methyladenine DNA glycosylase AlkC
MASAQERFSLKDHMFNAQTVGQLAQEYAAGIPSFDAAKFEREALSGFAERELMQRLEWMADCVEDQLSSDFPTMADQLEAAMPTRLDPVLTDDDFGHFIHAVPGILAVRHGLEDHRERALDLLYVATQRFSMEFYIRPFLNRWPDETLTRLVEWGVDENYHVRRLVSEGTRPRLPWAKSITLTQDQTVPLLNRLHCDQTRYVTRSVANHLNDIAKIDADRVVGLLREWSTAGKQSAKELNWMTRHGLRTLVKQGHVGALDLLGFRADAPVRVSAKILTPVVVMGDAVSFEIEITSETDCPVLVDYRIDFARADGKRAEKVFKLKQGKVGLSAPLSLQKSHKLKAGASTFTLYEGAHHITIQVNGMDHTILNFEMTG